MQFGFRMFVSFNRYFSELPHQQSNLTVYFGKSRFRHGKIIEPNSPRLSYPTVTNYQRVIRFWLFMSHNISPQYFHDIPTISQRIPLNLSKNPETAGSGCCFARLPCKGFNLRCFTGLLPTSRIRIRGVNWPKEKK